MEKWLMGTNMQRKQLQISIVLVPTSQMQIILTMLIILEGQHGDMGSHYLILRLQKKELLQTSILGEIIIDMDDGMVGILDVEQQQHKRMA
ncbi:MAG: hypothetical protein H6767_09460 [Candidatus Peribacteria bacterium]|nr:MAG: hypothetical protein H6767_09460 [Candidatus Peribacteria bacterium]